MADSNKISYKDLIDEDGILSGLKSLVTKMIAEIKVQAGTSGASLSANKGTTANDLKKQAKDIEDIEKAEKSLLQAEKELVKIEKEKLALQKQLQDANDENVKAKIRYSKASKEQREQLALEMKIAENAEGSYNRLSAQYALNTKTLNAMSDAQRKNSVEGKKLEAETKAIREQMNALQKSTGNYTLQVGNYNIATDNAVKSLGEMKSELRALRNISFAGKSKEEVDALKIKIGQLTDQMGDLQSELEVLGTEKSAVLVGGLKLISAGVEGVVGTLSVLGVESETIKKLETKMTSLIAVTHALAEIEDTISSGKARAIVLRIKDMALTTAQTVKNWALTASQKAYNLVVGNSTGALKGFKLALAGTGIGLVIIGITALIQNWDKLTASINKSTDAQKEFKKVKDLSIEKYSEEVASLELIRNTLNDTTKSTIDRKDALVDLDAILGTSLATEKDINLATAIGNNLVIEKIKLTKLEAEAEAAKELYTEAFKKKLEAENSSLEQNIGFWEQLWNNIKTISNPVQTNLANIKTAFKNQEEATKTAGDEQEKYFEIWQKSNEAVNIATVDFEKLISKFKAKTDVVKTDTKETKDNTSATKKLKVEIEELDEALKDITYTEKERAKQAELTTEEIDMESDAYTNLTELISMQEKLLKSAIARGESKEVIKSMANVLNSYKKELKGFDKLFAELTGETEKELYNTITETTNNIVESYKKRSEAKEENLNKELEASKDYETQLRELAKKGIEGAKENLAYEQKAQAEIEKKKLAEQKKQKRLELGMSAISAFGKIAETEPDKALTKTITEITKLLAFINSLPAFADGVIEFNGKGTTKSDSNLVRLSNKESVIKAEATEMYKPHLKAMNELRYNPLDYVDINKDRSVTNNATFGLISELKELKEITKSKQEYKIDVDGITHEIVERIKSANTININRYKRKGLF